MDRGKKKVAKILIVDDSMLIRSVLKNFVKSQNHDTIEASEGNEAIEKYRKEKPDLVFMDIVMNNGLDGISAVREIKKIDPNAKIVMVTSVKEAKEEKETKELGVKDYLVKPFSKDEIDRVIKTYL